MSTGRYVTAKAHIVADSRTVSEFSSKVVHGEPDPYKGEDSRDEVVIEGEGYVDIIVKVSGMGLNELIDELDSALRETSALGEGSYGLLIIESDFGIDGYECYGDVELAEVPGGDRVWGSEDYLIFEISLTAGEWAKLLGCDIDALVEEFESRGSELLPMFLPEYNSAVVEHLNGESFDYNDIDPFNFDGTPYDPNDEVSVLFQYSDHDLTHRAFVQLVRVVNDACSEPAVANAKMLLRFFNADEGELYENKMADIDTFALLEFKTSWKGVSDIRVLEPRATRK